MDLSTESIESLEIKNLFISETQRCPNESYNIPPVSLQEDRSISEIINQGQEQILEKTRFKKKDIEEIPKPIDTYFKKRPYIR